MIIEILFFLSPIVNMYKDQNAQFVLHTLSELVHHFHRITESHNVQGWKGPLWVI